MRDEGRWNKKGKATIFNVVITQFFFNSRFKLKNKNRYFQLLIAERLVGQLESLDESFVCLFYGDDCATKVL